MSTIEIKSIIAEVDCKISAARSNTAIGQYAQCAALVERVSDWQARAESVFGRISDNLTDIKIPDFESPSPRPPDPPSNRSPHTVHGRSRRGCND